MTFWRLVLSSLVHHSRVNLAVALGAAAATAVLTGALLVGDSVRGSLTAITLDRLGKIEEVLVVDRFFGVSLADAIRKRPNYPGDEFPDVQPAILFPNATIEIRREGKVQRSGNVLLVGMDDAFWQLDTAGIEPPVLQGDQIILNQQLASQWQGEVGESVTLRLPRPTAIPADSAYGRKDDNVISLPDLEIVEVVPNRGLGRFSLHPSQTQPLVAFVPMKLLQETLEQAGKANALLVAGADPTRPASIEASEQLQATLSPSLADLGFRVERVTRKTEEGVVFDYYSFESDQMLISPEAMAIAENAFQPLGGYAAFTYFVNTIDGPGEQAAIPYSLVAAIEPNETFDLQRLAGMEQPLQPGQIVLTDWAAKDLKVNVGDTIKLTYYEPETSHGVAREQSADFKLIGIAPLAEPDEPFDGDTPAIYSSNPPSPLNDPDFTPVVEGITDKDSIANLDVPFPFDIDRLREQDDTFWRNHRATPKAYIHLGDGARLWGSRFGNVTSYRIPHREGMNESAIADAFLDEKRQRDETLGFEFQAVKRRGLQASSGTTPFDGLFLGLSMFIIAAALMLVSLLFRLGVEQRLSELGVLLASGFRQRRVGRVFLTEGVLVAGIGGALGILLGVGYAWLMLVGLTTVWVEAIATPFLEFHWTPRSLLLGFASGVLASSATIFFAVRSAARQPINQLLAGRTSSSLSRKGRPGMWRFAAGLLLLAAIGLAAYGVGLSGEAQAGCFVGSGAAVLTSLMLLTWTQLRFSGEPNTRISLGSLAIRNTGRNPSRSTTTIGLMAVATFLIVSMSAFRLDPSLEGAGGFQLSATSSQPIFADLNTVAAKNELLADQADVLEDGHVLAFRVKPGADASCRNLYQATAPIVLGVTDRTIDYFDQVEDGFVFADSAATTPEQQRNPWRLLQSDADGGADDAIPVVLDKNTAAFSLHLMGGVGEEFEAEYEGYGKVRFRVVGLLANSVLQGRLLIAEQPFTQVFPDIEGYRYFLIRSPQPQAEVAEALEDRLGDQGFDTQSTLATLEGLLAVQNTYLSTFQALGSLGLLLGTFGLATVQLRSVLERRGELALMRAAGFRRGRVARMVLLENASLLAAGLLLGVIAAVVAIAPHVIATGADIPWSYLILALLAVFVVGMTSSITSVRATMNAPVIAALRGE